MTNASNREKNGIALRSQGSASFYWVVWSLFAVGVVTAASSLVKTWLHGMTAVDVVALALMLSGMWVVYQIARDLTWRHGATVTVDCACVLSFTTPLRRIDALREEVRLIPDARISIFGGIERCASGGRNDSFVAFVRGSHAIPLSNRPVAVKVGGIATRRLFDVLADMGISVEAPQ